MQILNIQHPIFIPFINKQSVLFIEVDDGSRLVLLKSFKPVVTNVVGDGKEDRYVSLVVDDTAVPVVDE